MPYNYLLDPKVSSVIHITSEADICDHKWASTETLVLWLALSFLISMNANIQLPLPPSLIPQSRKAHNIDLNGAVVIFDEAHNVVRLYLVSPVKCIH